MEAEVVDVHADLVNTLSVLYKDKLTLLKRDLPHDASFYFNITDLSKYQFDVLLKNPRSLESTMREAVVTAGKLRKEDGDLSSIKVRFFNYPLKTPIKKLNSDRIGTFVAVEGIVKNVTKVIPKVYRACYECKRCGNRMYVEIDRVMEEPEREDCSCHRGLYRLLPDKSEIKDAQFITVQELPEGMLGGEMPHNITIELYDDLCGKIQPGNRVVVNGLLRAVQVKSKDALLDQIIVVNSIETKEREFSEIVITEEEERRILGMSSDPNIFDRIAGSIAPSIMGHDNVKSAIALQLFGGVGKDLVDGTTRRGDIHILLCGDPGLAKSQMLKSVMKLSPRAVITSGKMSSTAGLTATVVKDAAGHWTLEAGAVVLADKALLIVDEIDKMRDDDRDAMHTAMEQQEVYIAKAGITTTLHSRCAILAAANPDKGRFDMYEDLASQVNMPPTLLSRFDLIFLMIDTPNPDKDERLARFILTSEKDAKYDINILRKYIAYARRESKPVFTPEAHTILIDYYVKMRGMGGRDKPMPITARQLEALSRLAEASARSRLSDKVEVVDSNRVVDIMMDCLKDVAFDSMRGVFDIDKATAKMSQKSRDSVHELLTVIGSLQGDGSARVEDVVNEMVARKLLSREKVEQMIDQFLREGRLISPRYGLVKLV